MDIELPVWFWPVMLQIALYLLTAALGAAIGCTWFMLTLHDLLKKFGLYEVFEERLEAHRRKK
jgi:hypothetical protein